MSDRIDSAPIAAPRRDVAPPNQSAPVATGTWQGESVTMVAPDLAELISNAKEEMTFAASEEVETKTIKERDVEDARDYPMHLVEGKWEAQGYKDHLPDFDLRRLLGLLAELRDGASDPDEVLRQVRQRFPDPTHADAALEMAEGIFADEGRTDRAEVMARARAALRSADGPAILAGRNVGAAAFDLAHGDPAAAQSLRDGYRATVFSSPGPASVFRGLVSRMDTAGGFPDQIRFLTRALGDDLASEGPSIERPRLQQLIGDLSSLRVLATVQDRCTEMADRLRRQSGLAIEVPDIMKAILPLTEDPVSGPSRLLALADLIGVPSSRLDTQVLLLREARELVAMLPPQVFRDSDARLAVLEGIQEAMDITIEREEAQ